MGLILITVLPLGDPIGVTDSSDERKERNNPPD